MDAESRILPQAEIDQQHLWQARLRKCHILCIFLYSNFVRLESSSSVEGRGSFCGILSSLFMDNFRLARQNRRTVSSLDAIYSWATDGRTGKVSSFWLELNQHLRSCCVTSVRKQISWRLPRDYGGSLFLRRVYDRDIITHKVTLWRLYADTNAPVITGHFVWCLPAPRTALWPGLCGCLCWRPCLFFSFSSFRYVSPADAHQPSQYGWLCVLHKLKKWWWIEWTWKSETIFLLFSMATTLYAGR